MIQAIYDACFEGWTFFLAFFVSVSVIMLIRQLFAWRFYHLFKQKKILAHPARKRGATLFVTIFDEDPDMLEKSLRTIRASFEKHCSELAILAMVDGFDLFPVKGDRLAAIASQYAEVVLVTNARSKRQNLRNLMKEAQDRGLLHEFSCFLDSDTILDHEDVAGELLRPFADPTIGGVTTAQRVYRPKSGPERISDWLENARLYASMAGGSLFGQVGCLPGRLYAVRSAIVADKMDELVDDRWRFLFRKPVQCYAGDDRVITNFVLQAGYRTTLMPTASVKTLVPDNYPKLWKTWERWGRSSQGYTLRGLNWNWRKPFILFQYTTDILISLSTVYLVAIHWPYNFFFGDSNLPLAQALLMSITGMCLTVLFRQSPHLAKNPHDIWLIPLFAVVITIGQFIRVKALVTPHRIGVWGTRKGADTADTEKTWVSCRWEYGNYLSSTIPKGVTDPLSEEFEIVAAAVNSESQPQRQKKRHLYLVQ